MSLSNYAELKLLDAIGNATAFSVTTPYIKLHIGDPGEDGTGNAAGETTRKSVSFAAAASGSMASDADIVWTNVSTSETLSHFSLWDASTNGNCLWTGAISPSKAVTAGDTFQISSGNLTLSLD